MHLISKLLAAITLTSCHMSHEPSLYDWLKYSQLQVGSSEGMPLSTPEERQEGGGGEDNHVKSSNNNN